MSKMPTYTCEKCARVFKQKSGYDDHKTKKNDCSKTTVLNTVIENKVIETVREVIRSTQTLPEVTTENMPAFFEALHNLLWNKAGLNPESALIHMIFFFAYRLIEQQADIIGLPQECRWSYLVSLKNENDLFETIKNGVTAFRRNPATKPFFKPHEIQKADVVFEIVQQINRISIHTLQNTDTLGDIFEYMLGRGMSTMADEGQYFTSRMICKLAFKMAFEIKGTLRRPNGSLCTFADWFCGTGGFPAEYVKGVRANLSDVDWTTDSRGIYCQDMNLSSVTTTLLNMLILTGIPFSNDTIRGSNSFTDPITKGVGASFPGLSIDYCFMNPPYGGDKTKGKEYKFAYSKVLKADDGTKSKRYYVNEDIQSIGIEDDDKVSAGVQLGMATLSNDGGVCCIVLPQGFFFGASKKGVELRKKITEEYKIHYIVDIASGSFTNTGTKTSMMVFQKGVGPTEKVQFIGLNETLLVETTLEGLREKYYSLNYKQYLPQSVSVIEGFEIVKLGDVCKLISGYAFKSDNFTTSISDLRVLKIKNIQNQHVIMNETDDRYPYTDNLAKFIVHKNEFVIAMTGATTGKIGIHISDERLLLNQRVGKFTAFTDRVLPVYIYYYIRDHPNIFMDLAAGTARDNISPEQIMSVQIPIPSLEQQQKIVESIDGWTQLAQLEETSLKLLEKQVMFEVKEMGYGQPNTKLNNILKPIKGKRFPVGEGKDSGKYPLLRSSKDGKVKWMDTYEYDGPYITVGNGGTANFCFISKFNASTHTLVYDVFEDYSKQYIYYSIINCRDMINELCFQGTGLENLNMSMFMDIDIACPPLAVQQTLQPEFDEIRHKQQKIDIYKTKAQEAIRRLIPGA